PENCPNQYSAHSASPSKQTPAEQQKQKRRNNQSNAAGDYNAKIDEEQGPDRKQPASHSFVTCQGCVANGAKPADQKYRALENRIVHRHSIDTVPSIAECESNRIRSDQQGCG